LFVWSFFSCISLAYQLESHVVSFLFQRKVARIKYLHALLLNSASGLRKHKWDWEYV
jgi:hypothetical protein